MILQEIWPVNLGLPTPEKIFQSVWARAEQTKPARRLRQLNIGCDGMIPHKAGEVGLFNNIIKNTFTYVWRSLIFIKIIKNTSISNYYTFYYRKKLFLFWPTDQHSDSDWLRFTLRESVVQGGVERGGSVEPGQCWMMYYYSTILECESCTISVWDTEQSIKLVL